MGGCTPSGADVNVIRVLLFVLESHDDQLRKLLLRMICEVVQTLNWNEHFHAKSVTTAMQFQCINVTTQQL
ncbi:hypothetical protein PF008_g27193 [Phytophthora fragariae]|uniref:Uncharacterized protein n=1 Tax=Phytophthora fragariae TaxID=53985 RepID=A0A6G0QEV3_9STRA|nr:hypothetical protein PF008_g27193 [Phytophthora fragariae]